MSLIVVLIPAIGLALNVLGFGTAFERSGAVMVAFAIACVYFNHFVSKNEKEVDNISRATGQFGNSIETIEAVLNPNIDHAAKKGIAAGILHSKYKVSEELPQLQMAQDRLVKIEFIAGVFGTLIWGFGDFL